MGLPALDEKPEHGHEDEPEEVPGHDGTGPAQSGTLRCCSPIADLSLAEVESYYFLPGSLPALPELAESGSEAGSSSQMPQSPEVHSDEFFDTKESVEDWADDTESLPHSGMPLDVGATHTVEP